MPKSSMSCPYCGSSYANSTGNVTLSQRKDDGKFTLKCPRCNKQYPGYLDGSIQTGRMVPDEGQKGGSSGCLAAGTRILLPDGTDCRIEKIAKTQQVLAYHNGIGRFVSANVDKVTAHPPTKVVRLCTDEGEIIVTPKHRVYAKEKWVSVCALRGNDKIGVYLIRTFKFHWVRVKSLEVLVTPQPVFNLYVDDACTFISNGILTHSYVVMPNLRTMWNRSGVKFGKFVRRNPEAPVCVRQAQAGT